MTMFRIELKEAKPTNGHSGADPISLVEFIEAEDWHAARMAAAQKHHIDVYTPAMFATAEVQP